MLRESCASPADWSACRAAIQTGSRSFYAASLLMPRRARAAAYALYAFCRDADDLADAQTGPTDPLATLDALEARLRAIYAGRPADHPFDRAFADVVASYRLPIGLPRALLEGFRWDAAGRDYATISELEAYAARVASSVGAMMCVLMGERRPDMLARACDLGAAMQLTNIARDVGEDARLGRVYLPADWLAAEGLSPADLRAAPQASPALARVIARLLDHADQLYARAEAGIVQLPFAMRPAIMAARLIYAEIGAVIAANDFDSLSQRAVVASARKRALASQALSALWRPGKPADLAAPAMAGAAFLVDIAAAATPPQTDRGWPWVMSLFLALGERDPARPLRLAYPHERRILSTQG